MTIDPRYQYPPSTTEDERGIYKVGFWDAHEGYSSLNWRFVPVVTHTLGGFHRKMTPHELYILRKGRKDGREYRNAKKILEALAK